MSQTGLPGERSPGCSVHRRFAFILLWILLLTLTTSEASEKLLTKLKAIPACPALVSAANVAGISLQEISSFPGVVTNGLQPGDSATVLATFTQKKKQTQWLLHLVATTPDTIKPPKRPSRFVVNSSFGSPMEFTSKLAPVKLRMLGPFAVTGSTKELRAEDKTEIFSLNEGFLALGLDQSAALLHRWSQTTNFDKAVTSKALLAMNPTPAEQRAISGTFPALLSYFNIVRHSKGLESILRKLVELPSIWSIMRHGGVEADLSFGHGLLPWQAEAIAWNLPAATPVYHFPWLLQLNEEPALKITLVVTRPQPPLLICGGVVGLLAEKIGDEETYLTLRVMSAGHRTD